MSRCCSRGSPAMAAGQSVASSSPSNRSAATAQKASTISGSNCLPRRDRANSMAASVPPRSLGHLGEVRQVEEPDRASDVLAAETTGHTAAVPPGEPLLQRLAHVLAQTKALGHEDRAQAVRHEPTLDGLAPGHDQRAGQAEPLHGRAPRSHACHCVLEHRQAGQIHLVAALSEGDVVAEPVGHLRGVGHAPDPGQHRHVVERRCVLVLDAHVLTETGGDGPGPQDVLHRLAQPEISGEREGRDDLRQAQAGVSVVRWHGYSLRASAGGSPGTGWSERRRDRAHPQLSKSTSSRTGAVTTPRGWVSYMRTATTAPDAAVMAATV